MTSRRFFLSGAAAFAALARHARSCCGRRLPRRFASRSIRKQSLATMPTELHWPLLRVLRSLAISEFFAPRTISNAHWPLSGGSSSAGRVAHRRQHRHEYTVWSDERRRRPAKNHTPRSRLAPTPALPRRRRRFSLRIAIRNLNDFVEAIGRRVIYGLDLRHGTPENAAAEGCHVSATPSATQSLICFLPWCNEPDMNHAEGSEDR